MAFKKGVASSLVIVACLLSACENKVSEVPSEANIVKAKDIPGETNEEKIAHVYDMKREHLSSEGILIDEAVEKELGIKSNDLDADRVESVLKEVLSRKDGATNETKDPYVKVMTPYTYQQVRFHFERWVNGEINEDKLQERWNALLVEAVYPMKESMVVEKRFANESDILNLVDNMVQHVGEKTGTTAPHVLAIKVKKDEFSEEFLLYLALAEVE